MAMVVVVVVVVVVVIVALIVVVIVVVSVVVIVVVMAMVGMGVTGWRSLARRSHRRPAIVLDRQYRSHAAAILPSRTSVVWTSVHACVHTCVF